MNKLVGLLSLLLMGMVFAYTPPPLTGGDEALFVGACCHQYALYYFGMTAETYQITGSCVYPTFTYDYMYVFNQMWGPSSVDYYADYMRMQCDQVGGYGPTSPECYSAKREFYGRVSQAKQVFRAAQLEYMSAARQGLQAFGTCGYPGISNVAGDLQDFQSHYRDCVAYGCYYP